MSHFIADVAALTDIALRSDRCAQQLSDAYTQVTSKLVQLNSALARLGLSVANPDLSTRLLTAVDFFDQAGTDIAKRAAIVAMAENGDLRSRTSWDAIEANFADTTGFSKRRIHNILNDRFGTRTRFTFSINQDHSLRISDGTSTDDVTPGFQSGAYPAYCSLGVQALAREYDKVSNRSTEGRLRWLQNHDISLANMPGHEEHTFDEHVIHTDHPGLAVSTNSGQHTQSHLEQGPVVQAHGSHSSAGQAQNSTTVNMHHTDAVVGVINTSSHIHQPATASTPTIPTSHGHAATSNVPTPRGSSTMPLNHDHIVNSSEPLVIDPVAHSHQSASSPQTSNGTSTSSDYMTDSQTLPIADVAVHDHLSSAPLSQTPVNEIGLVHNHTVTTPSELMQISPIQHIHAGQSTSREMTTTLHTHSANHQSSHTTPISADHNSASEHSSRSDNDLTSQSAGHLMHMANSADQSEMTSMHSTSSGTHDVGPLSLLVPVLVGATAASSIAGAVLITSRLSKRQKVRKAKTSI